MMSAAGMALVKAYRHFGHMAARLDPLGSEPPGDPALDPAPLGLTPELMAQVPAERRATLIATKTATPGEYRWDVRLQGEGETVFFDYE